MEEYIRTQIENSIAIKSKMVESPDLLNRASHATKLCIEALKNGNKILVAGNGGSAADAQHIAGELVSRFYYHRPALPAIALTVDTSILTAIGNDYGYEFVFSRQVEALGKKGDIFIGISTSGNSANIIRAAESAKIMGLKIIILTGEHGGGLKDCGDVTIKVPSNCTPIIQECHISIAHAICASIEREIFPK